MRGAGEKGQQHECCGCARGQHARSGRGGRLFAVCLGLSQRFVQQIKEKEGKKERKKKERKKKERKKKRKKKKEKSKLEMQLLISFHFFFPRTIKVITKNQNRRWVTCKAKVSKCPHTPPAPPAAPPQRPHTSSPAPATPHRARQRPRAVPAAASHQKTRRMPTHTRHPQRDAPRAPGTGTHRAGGAEQVRGPRQGRQARRRQARAAGRQQQREEGAKWRETRVGPHVAASPKSGHLERRQKKKKKEREKGRILRSGKQVGASGRR